MRLILVVVLSCCLCAASFALSYERGSCDISISSIVQDMFKSEMRALLNPMLRTAVNTRRIRYDLYTPNNPNERQILRTGDVQSLRISNFNPKWPVRISIHGWTGKSSTCSNAAIKDAYMSRGNFNVIIIDWSEYAFDISYSRMSKLLSNIAASIVKFTHFLNRETGVAFKNIYLIGHSAGAHISGLAGKILKPNSFGAIIALDPAGLAQLHLGENFRLAPTDAVYVEAIHTDTTLLGNPNTDLAHAAFFFNWGQGQPQCPNATAAELDIACDHFSAIYYFAESVRNAYLFGALRCKNTPPFEKLKCNCSNGQDLCSANAYMGGEPVVPKRGVYYLSTHSWPPYGYGAVVHMKKPIKPSYLLSKNFRQTPSIIYY